MKRVLFFICFFASFLIWSQNRRIDSLQNLLKTDKEDSNKVNHLNNIAREISSSKPDSALSLSTKALAICQKIKWQLGSGFSYHNIGYFHFLKGNYVLALEEYNKALKIWKDLEKNTNNKPEIKSREAKTLGNMGLVFYSQDDYPQALNYYFKALEIDEESGNKKGIAKRLGNIGIVYVEQGNYPKALDYYFKSLKITEDLGDKNGTAITLSNLGNIYGDQGDFTKALDYYFKALKLGEELGDKKGIAARLGNIGNVYRDQSKYKLALEYYFKALKSVEEIGDKNAMAIIISNMGVTYKAQSNYTEALTYNLKALKLTEELGDKTGVASNLANIGTVYIDLKEYKTAFNYLYNALEVSDSINARNYTKDIYNSLSTLYEKSNVTLEDTIKGKVLTIEQMRLRSKYYYIRYISIKDLIFSEESKKQLVRKEMNFEFEKREAIAQAEHEKQSAVAAAENKKQQIFIWLIAAVAIAVGFITIIILRSLRITKKQKNIIEKQKQIVEKQKEIVEEHQKEIIDSIKYAKRIQQALLPHEKYIEKNLHRLIKK